MSVRRTRVSRVIPEGIIVVKAYYRDPENIIASNVFLVIAFRSSVNS